MNDVTYVWAGSFFHIYIDDSFLITIEHSYRPDEAGLLRTFKSIKGESEKYSMNIDKEDISKFPKEYRKCLILSLFSNLVP